MNKCIPFKTDVYNKTIYIQFNHLLNILVIHIMRCHCTVTVVFIVLNTCFLYESAIFRFYYVLIQSTVKIINVW